MRASKMLIVAVATRGKDIVVAQGAKLSVKLTQPLHISGPDVSS